MGNIVPEPTYQETRTARILDMLAWDLAALEPDSEPLHARAVRIIRLALHRAEEYAAKVEKDGEESATAAMLREDR